MLRCHGTTIFSKLPHQLTPDFSMNNTEDEKSNSEVEWFWACSLLWCGGVFFFFFSLMFYMPTMSMSLSVYVFLSISVTVTSLIIWLCLAFASGKLGLFFKRSALALPLDFCCLCMSFLFSYICASFQRLSVIVHCIWVHNVKTHNRSAGYVFGEE